MLGALIRRGHYLTVTYDQIWPDGQPEVDGRANYGDRQQTNQKDGWKRAGVDPELPVKNGGIWPESVTNDEALPISIQKIPATLIDFSATVVSFLHFLSTVERRPWSAEMWKSVCGLLQTSYGPTRA
ncbi:TPA: hypothetical protein SLP05_004073 [Pseudomonas putida]|uniref:Uncharacterized protein n=1 Tax=Pseudomonas juntendi TaxID=2666183 RepID=A0ABZ2JBD1_9PSED|nr:hypothetical protein [Pseudomonas putida]ELS0925966.1 hypothetical protein [Pseudomonas putida]HDS0940495.1 hypothetical protein [Pseudomonas putida]HEJ1056469.1 hypothetical protein [Pseudomonas putida]